MQDAGEAERQAANGERAIMLVSATYDSFDKHVMLKFYDPESNELVLWKDNTGHKPYCYSKLEPADLGNISRMDNVSGISQVYKHDLTEDRQVALSKITVPDPYVISGTHKTPGVKNMIETWESGIRYYESYMYDMDLVVGRYYSIRDGKVVPLDMEISGEVKESLQTLLWDKVDSKSMVDADEFKKFVTAWADLLNQPIPSIKRMAVDIEVEVSDRLPDATIADKKITAIGMKGTGFDTIFVLRTEGTSSGQNELADHVKVVFYDRERDMIRDAMRIMKMFPFILTYNGDDFDMPFLYNRAKRLGIKDADNPLKMVGNAAMLKVGIHLDLYRIMSNRSFQIYAFSQAYADFSLDSVSKALLGRGKTDYGLNFDEMTLYETANYCYNDALLTYDLTNFNNEILMNLLVIIARIGRMPMDDVARMGVSQWIKSLLYYEHRVRGFLIPNREDLDKRSIGVKSDAVIKGKKYKGGQVVQPKEGVHFNVTVMDFASLYPSIIKVKNLSYETVRCPHDECHSNMIPNTNHWACTKRDGLTAMIIGSLRDLRVNYYKSLSKKESLTEKQRDQYTVVSQALKVILNASYGVMGADIFPLYFLPAAEATTAIGRHTIQGSIEICKENGVEVLYGDSVLGDTPVTCEKDGVRQIIPIRSLIAPTITHGRQKHKSLRVMSDNGFVDVKHSYSHKVKKLGYRVGTRKSYVEVTDDHSLVVDGREVKPHQLNIGDHIDLAEPPTFGNGFALSEDIAWLFGFYLSDGTLGQYGTKRSWKIVKNDRAKLEMAQNIMSEHFGFYTTIRNNQSEGKLHTLVPANRSVSAVIEYFRYHCYSNETKIVPPCVLNGTKKAKEAFMRGLVDGDGHVDAKDHSITLGQIHKSILAGYISVITSLGHDYSLKFRTDKPNFISVRIIMDVDDARIRDGDAVTLLEPFQIDECVYDLSTANGHFRGGLGNVLLHNTDSVFLLSPSKDQINSIIAKARGEFHVDLEVDKEYRFCVFSDRKKNYFGVTKSGRLDIKGLTGKKSHTPPIIKQAFNDVMDILKTIQTRDDFEASKKKISEKIAHYGGKIESKDVKMKDMAFTIKLSKPPSDYKKTIPQHIKAARQLDNAADIKSGDRISYVKVIGKIGVKPIEKARNEEIDSRKYMEFMESTLEQITSSMGLDFATMMNKPKQAGLEEFFW